MSNNNRLPEEHAKSLLFAATDFKRIQSDEVGNRQVKRAKHLAAYFPQEVAEIKHGEYWIWILHKAKKQESGCLYK